MDIASQKLPGAKGNPIKLTGVTASAGGDTIPCDGLTFFIAQNIDDTDPCTVTITAEADKLGRKVDLTQVMAATTFYLFGPFDKVQGWATPGGKMNISASDPTIAKWFVGTLPAF